MSKRGMVVGDCFSGFSSVAGIFTVSALAERLRQLGRGAYSDTALPTLLMWGQGVSESDRAYLGHLVRQVHDRAAITLQESGQKTSASRGHVHKHAPQNVLVSVPARVDEHQFMADLIIDARNELLLDHVTGQHVQGMVLIEAVRQMFLAVTEEHLFDERTPAETYFVIKSMSFDYKSFVFPVDASLSLRLEQIKRSNGRLAVTASIGVWQQGTECVSSVVSYSVFDADHLKTREIELADACVRGVFAVGQRPYPSAPERQMQGQGRNSNFRYSDSEAIAS